MKQAFILTAAVIIVQQMSAPPPARLYCHQH